MKQLTIYEACNFLNEKILKDKIEDTLSLYHTFNILFIEDRKSIYPVNKDGKSYTAIEEIVLFVVR